MFIFLLDRIRQKLFAIKPTNVHDSSESVNDKHRIHYDVYYPDNEVPKTSRPAPDFRVIVFEYDKLNNTCLVHFNICY